MSASRLEIAPPGLTIAAAITDPVQGLFDFESGNMNGYDNWRPQHEERLQPIRNEWHLPVRRPVRGRLKNIDGDFERVLRLVDQPLTIDSRLPLHLRIDNPDVLPDDIEQCVVIGETHAAVTPL